VVLSEGQLYGAVKRVVDCVVAACSLLLLAPVLAVIAVAIRVTMGPPVLFRQTRPGLNERSFTCLKFRTMRLDHRPAGSALNDFERLTRLGIFLRRTSLDEIPQLWNILRGEMSLVGPRPLLIEYLPYYSADERRRHLVRPGLTGWAQIHGRNTVSFDRRLQMDTWYVDHASWRLDIQILLATVGLVLHRRGVNVGAEENDTLAHERRYMQGPQGSDMRCHSGEPQQDVAPREALLTSVSALGQDRVIPFQVQPPQ
jgi:lipopolysaccharide/colanic/teichoic acid biosynthesis glycosyltransferase